MATTNDRLKELAAGYWDATLSQEQEHELRELLATNQSPLDEELATLKMMFSGFESILSDFEEVKEPKTYGFTRRIMRLSIGLSAAAVLAVGLFVAFKTPDPVVYCYINGEPITDIEVAMEQTKYLSSLSQLSQPINLLESLKIE